MALEMKDISNEKLNSLAGLLHDIGKFMQRAEIEKRSIEVKNEVEKNKELYAKLKNHYYGYLHVAYTAYFIDKFLEISDNDIKYELNKLASSHHISNNIIKKADIYSASMDRIVDDDNLTDEEKSIIENLYGKKEHYKKIRQQSIFDKVFLYRNFNKDSKDNSKKGLNKIELKEIDYENLDEIFPKYIESEELIPKEGKSLVERYQNLWKNFIDEYSQINKVNNFDAYYNQLYYLLQKYTSNIPSSTINYPDISLFDHLRTTAALASCLMDSKDEFILLEGDISGIQKFIFKITDSEDKSKVAKRLRGRSFYIMILTEFFSKYIIDYFDLPITNILYSGGGKFQIILPTKTEKFDNIALELKNLEEKINRWLFEKYDGLISIIFGIIKEKIKIFDGKIRNYSDLLYEMSKKLNRKKKQKFLFEITNSKIKNEDFFVMKNEINDDIRKCKICGVKLKKDEKEVCELCKEHEKIGRILVKEDKLIVYTKRILNKLEYENMIKIDFSPFGYVYILDYKKIIGREYILLNDEEIMDIIKVNNTDSKKTIKGFKFLGDTVPKTIDKITKEDIEFLENEIYLDEPLTFEVISNLAIGDKKLGILKMDVDNLGMIFAMGFDEGDKNKKSEKSISRIASLSRNFDIFFGGYLNKICNQVFEEWKTEVEKNGDEKLKELSKKVNNIFYITYSGGDDLFIVGPWDYTIELALKIRNELKRFTGYNPNIEISGGIAIVKNKYPISNAAQLAEEFLERSKQVSVQKGMISVFDTSMSWEEKTINGIKYKRFEDVLNKAKEYVALIKTNKISRGLIRHIYELNLKYCNYRRELNPQYIPHLLYKLSRTLDEEYIKKFEKELIEEGYFKEFKFMGSYVLEKTRGGM